MADPAAAQKLRVDRFSDGGVTCLKLAGIIDEQFDGKGLAAQVRGGVLVLDLADIERISSFGIREWVDFVAAVGEALDLELLASPGIGSLSHFGGHDGLRP